MNKIICFILLLIFIFSYELQSQSVDSLIHSLDAEKSDTSRINTYIKIVKLLNSKEPIKALPYAISLAKLAEKVNIEKKLTASYNQLGITYYLLGNTTKSAELFLKVLNINEKNKDSLSISRSLNNIGLAYHDEKAYSRALDYLKQSLDIKIKIKDYQTLWTTYLNIGLAYIGLNEYDTALANFYKGLDAWRILKEPKNGNYASIMSEIGMLHQKTDSLDKSEEELNEAVKYFRYAKNTYRIANTQLNLAIVSRKRGNNIIAQNFADSSLKFINESGAFSLLPDCFMEFSMIEESKGNISKAFYYYKRQTVIRDSLNAKENLSELNRMQEIYRIEKLDEETLILKKEIELNNLRLERNKLFTTGVIILLSLVLIFSIFLLININRRRRANIKLNEQQRIITRANEILQQQKAELQILTDELRRSNANKDRFVSILAHDLKSPFNAILGFSQVLTEELDHLDIDKIREIAITINKSATNTYNLLEEILIWARTQSGKMPFNPKKLNFKDLCNSILEIMIPVANSKSITINYTPSEEIYVFADIEMLKTVLRNLISNAIKFTNRGGGIKILTEKKDSNITITVSDSGIGIEPDNSAKLFDLTQFYTTTGTANETGTGLGLLLCKEFVEMNGGRIWVQSVFGEGSDFKFTVPMYKD
jgi:signal transduction histidine kinase